MDGGPARELGGWWPPSSRRRGRLY